MAFWRMQLHPADHKGSQHAAESLAAGFIGLDFGQERGDMTLISDPTVLPQGERDYLEFATQMAPDDKVLLIAHHFPFALATVAGDYNYIRTPVPEIGVWFRHFRRVKGVRYYGDYEVAPLIVEKRRLHSLMDCQPVLPLVSSCVTSSAARSWGICR